jgi:Type IV leader peptidase family./Archaeal Peptidase A24 C-terminus Type II.
VFYSVIPVVSCALMLGIGAYEDLKKREIDDWVWFIATAGFGTNLYLLEKHSLLITPLQWAIEVVVLSALGISLYYLQLFGGADAKALFAIALALPSALPPFSSQIPFFGLTIFDNAVVISVLYSFSLFLSNICKALLSPNYFGRYSRSSFFTKLGLAFSSYKTTLGKYIKESYKLFPSEIPKLSEGKVVLTPILKRMTIDATELEEKYANLLKQGLLNENDEIWVSPGIPLVTFMFLGYVLTPLFGDLIFRLVSVIVLHI